MSLAAAALQIATVKALEGNLSATIFDSKADPMLLRDEPLPIVIVCASAGKRTVEGMGFFGAKHCVDLVLDLGIARKVTRRVDQGEGVMVDVEFPDNDAGHDVVLHTLGYEILRALLGSNGVWADLWRRIASQAHQQEPSAWDRGAVADTGVRLALTRHVMRLVVVDEPTPGAPLEGPWPDLLAAMDADAELSDMAKLWRSLITLPAAAPWQQVQAELGLTLGGVRAIGIAPVFETANEPAPAATQAEGEDKDRDDVITVTPGGATITQGSGDPTPLEEVT